MAANSQLQLTLLGHRFKIAVDEEDKPLMQEAARMVEEKNEDIRRESRVADSMRAAVMTALRIAFEARKGSIGGAGDDRGRIDALCAKIDAAVPDATEKP